jgi:hypothetical protein
VGPCRTLEARGATLGFIWLVLASIVFGLALLLLRRVTVVAEERVE